MFWIAKYGRYYCHSKRQEQRQCKLLGDSQNSDFFLLQIMSQIIVWIFDIMWKLLPFLKFDLYVHYFFQLISTNSMYIGFAELLIQMYSLNCFWL